ncbi:hypothetical protein niasHS_015441 [Heterodera schachtii]|uniref:Uncharacterized protein n=1 Tax=Heterodera schachtii TaxID=97005 RepID=A0ABD2I2K6_HETSC
MSRHLVDLGLDFVFDLGLDFVFDLGLDFVFDLGLDFVFDLGLDFVFDLGLDFVFDLGLDFVFDLGLDFVFDLGLDFVLYVDLDFLDKNPRKSRFMKNQGLARSIQVQGPISYLNQTIASSALLSKRRNNGTTTPFQIGQSIEKAWEDIKEHVLDAGADVYQNDEELTERVINKKNTFHANANLVKKVQRNGQQTVCRATAASSSCAVPHVPPEELKKHLLLHQCCVTDNVLVSATESAVKRSSKPATMSFANDSFIDGTSFFKWGPTSRHGHFVCCLEETGKQQHSKRSK